jgi:diamine N-acetyltransferase
VNDASEIEIREARVIDETALLRMMRALAEQEPGKIEFDEPAARQALQLLRAAPELGRAWLILENRTVVGYVVLTLSFSFEYRGRDAFIDELYIEPTHRRRGLGRAAIAFAEQQAKEFGINAVHLEVDHGNDPAMELYRRIGYSDHGRYLMTKWLTAK